MKRTAAILAFLAITLSRPLRADEYAGIARLIETGHWLDADSQIRLLLAKKPGDAKAKEMAETIAAGLKAWAYPLTRRALLVVCLSDDRVACDYAHDLQKNYDGVGTAYIDRPHFRADRLQELLCSAIASMRGYRLSLLVAGTPVGDPKRWEFRWGAKAEDSAPRLPAGDVLTPLSECLALHYPKPSAPLLIDDCLSPTRPPADLLPYAPPDATLIWHLGAEKHRCGRKEIASALLPSGEAGPVASQEPDDFSLLPTASCSQLAQDLFRKRKDFPPGAVCATLPQALQAPRDAYDRKCIGQKEVSGECRRALLDFRAGLTAWLTHSKKLSQIQEKLILADRLWWVIEQRGRLPADEYERERKQAAERLLEVEPSLSSVALLAVEAATALAIVRKGSWEEARKALARAQGLSPRDERLAALEPFIRTEGGKPELLQNEGTRLLLESPQSGWGQYFLAYYENGKGNGVTARNYLAQAVKLHPEITEFQNAYYRSVFGLVPAGDALLEKLAEELYHFPEERKTAAAPATTPPPVTTAAPAAEAVAAPVEEE